MNTLNLIKNTKPQIRTLREMQDVIYDKEWLKNTNLETPLYYMYRGLSHNEQNKKKIQAAGLRYDITIIPALMMGKEFVKTAGHGHNKHYPEIYEVLKGKAIYLMQKISPHCHAELDSASHKNTEKNKKLNKIQDDKCSIIKDIYIVKASKGDKVIIPPDYAHITINASSNKDLKMANWIAADYQGLYKFIKNKDGGGYFATKGFLGLKWIKNKKYSEIPKLKKRPPTNFKGLGLNKNAPMYTLVSNLDKLDFLNNPQNFEALWKKILT